MPEIERPPKKSRLDIELDDIDLKMIAYKAEYPAITDADLADLLNMERRQIWRRRARQIWKDAFAKHVMPAKDYLEDKREKAVRMYWKLAQSKNEVIAERVLSKMLISWGILRSEALQKEDGFEPIVINMPLYNKTVVIQNKPKDKEAIDVDTKEVRDRGGLV